MRGQPGVPAPDQSLGGDRTGKGYLAARPRSGPPPSRACWRLRVPRLFVLRRWGSGRPCHRIPGSLPRESSRPRFHNTPSNPCLRARQRPPGVARHPSARAPGVLPSPLPSHGPRGLDASAAAARRNAGAGWTGLQGPVSMGRGGRRGPDSGSASLTGAASAGRLSGGVPACSCTPGALSILLSS